MNETEERKIEGKLAFWTKEVREEPNPATGQTIYNLGFKMADSEEWHNIYAIEKTPLEKLKESAPSGSKISFVETKLPGSKRWTYRHGTFLVLEKGTGSSGGSKNFRSFETKEERQERQQREVAIASINAAVSFVSGSKEPGKALFPIAEKIEQWIVASKDRFKPTSKTEEVEEEDIDSPY